MALVDHGGVCVCVRVCVRDCFRCRIAQETAGEEDEGVSSAAAGYNTATNRFLSIVQAEEKRLQINEFLAAVLGTAAFTQAAQDEALIFLQM